MHGLPENNANALSCNSRVQTPPRVGKAAFLLEALGGNLFPPLFQLLQAACIPWPEAPCSSIVKASSTSIFKPLSDSEPPAFLL